MDSENSSQHTHLVRVRERAQKCVHTPRLGIITCAPNFETRKYLALKEKKAREVGIETTIIDIPGDASTEDVLTALTDLCVRTDGLVVQLPLPQHIDRDTVLGAIPATHALNTKTTAVLSPVVAAIREILAIEHIDPKEKQVTIIGSGHLVGLPAYHWFVKAGAHVSVVTRDTHDIPYYTRYADIIVSGAGVPKLITPTMVREGVVILDAGTSEDDGILSGDVDPEVAQKASLFTPVPGGIGPMTIALLLENVVELAEQKDSVV
jgi:methylenetetrahydrofolate dehydrogenase (NADP+) / methenyltetrahydrofolate cyclohydrolase